jgi:serine/threonine-protein kinase
MRPTVDGAFAGRAGGEAAGRYVLHEPIARGGMATVYLARQLGADGFSRLVAVKRLHPQFAADADFVAKFFDEARIASTVRHPNVVPVLDVVRAGGGALLVQEYVHGAPLDKLTKPLGGRRGPVPVRVAVAIAAGVLAGLHAAHEARDARGEPLEIVHRDVSPQNIIVGVDGVPRLLDFGIAKGRWSPNLTREGQFKGKVAYMAAEQLTGAAVTRAADLFALGVVLWEMLVGRRLHGGKSADVVVGAVLGGNAPTLSAGLASTYEGAERYAEVAPLEPVVARALARRPGDRYESAQAMLEALVAAAPPAPATAVAAWVKAAGAPYLEARDRALALAEERAAAFGDAAPFEPEAASGAAALGASPGSERNLPTALSSTSASAVYARGPSHLTPALLAALVLLTGVLAGSNLVLFLRLPALSAAATAPASPAAAAVTSAPVLGSEPPPDVPVGSAPRPPAMPPRADSAPHAEAAHAAPPRAEAAPHPAPTAHAPPRGPAPSPTRPAPTAGAGAAKVDCTTPFFFQGSKKVYKPACL